MTKPEDLPYSIGGRQLIAETDDLRVQILTLQPGEDVPWHHHTEVTDTFICLDGPMVVQLRDPAPDVELNAGEQVAVAPFTGHRVVGKDGGRCRFVIVQGIGAHDFITPEA